MCFWYFHGGDITYFIQVFPPHWSWELFLFSFHWPHLSWQFCHLPTTSHSSVICFSNLYSLYSSHDLFALDYFHLFYQLWVSGLLTPGSDFYVLLLSCWNRVGTGILICSIFMDTPGYYWTLEGRANTPSLALALGRCGIGRWQQSCSCASKKRSLEQLP